jgi:hypothetical protein
MMFLASRISFAQGLLPEVLWILHRFLPDRTVKTLRWRQRAGAHPQKRRQTLKWWAADRILKPAKRRQRCA